MPSNDVITASRRKWLICLGLALAVFVSYAGVIHLGFVDYDDGDYITNNPPIRNGVNWISLLWAFTTNWAANWHPLTWISLMIDYSFFGPNLTGYHVENAVWHLANTLLFFLWLEYATGAVWRSAAVAAFFGLHPFHVESVAWASERKDVLSTFFWILSVWFYCAYGRIASEKTPNRARLFYGASLGAFALGLLAKPMLVTLPCVLLLLDYWPLRRFNNLKRLVLEKIPFLVLSAGASVATVIAQDNGGALQSLVKYSMRSRLENVPVAYLRYLLKTFVPSGFTIFYLYVDKWVWWIVWGSVLILAIITLTALARRRQQPYLIVGWLWFLGILVPTIGIVQVGEQSMADRYSYVSLVGVFIMIAWSIGDFAAVRAWVAPVSAFFATAALLICSVLTMAQVAVWRDTSSLFGHSIVVGPNNYLAYYNLGCYMAKFREPANAIMYFNRCLAANTHYPRAYNNLAFLQIDAGDLDPAISNLQTALALRHDYPEAWLNLGRAYVAKNDDALAEQSFATALQQKPDLTDARYRLGDLFLRQGSFTNAAANLQAAVNAQPRTALYRLKLANALVGVSQMTNAVNQYEIALKLDPDLPEACNNLAWILATSPGPDLRDGLLAVELAKHAVQLTLGQNPLLLGTFAAACAEAGHFDQAARAAEQARQLALAQTNNPLAAALSGQISLYHAGQPFRDAHLK